MKDNTDNVIYLWAQTIVPMSMIKVLGLKIFIVKSSLALKLIVTLLGRSHEGYF